VKLLRPKPGARALDAGPRKQGTSLRGGCLPARYHGLTRGRTLARRRPTGVPATIYSFGVTTFTSRPGICTTRNGARPAR